LVALYQNRGRYAYSGGANLRAVAALIVGWIPPLIGLAFPPLHVLWQGGWFFGLIVAMLAYTLFMHDDRSKLTAAEFAAITE